MTNTNTTPRILQDTRKDEQANKITHNESEVAKLLAATMKDAATEGARQLQITVALWNEYPRLIGYTNLKSIFKMERSKRVELLDKEMGEISDAYEMTRKEYQKLLALKPTAAASDQARTEHAVTVEALLRKIKAARAMFDRALYSCAGLHDMKASLVQLSKKGPVCIMVKAPDPDFENSTANFRRSGNMLASAGQKRIKDDVGTKTNATGNKAKTQAVKSFADASKVMATALKGLSPDLKKQGLANDVFSDELEKNARSVLKEMFALEFMQAGHINIDLIKLFVKEQFGEAALDEDAARQRDALAKQGKVK